VNDAPRKTWDALAAHGPAVELFPGWDSRSVCSFIERSARHLVEVEGLRSGEACSMRIGNRSAHVLGLLAALHAGARVVLLGADEPEAELERVARALGGARELRLQAEEPEPALRLIGVAPSAADDAGAAILLRTSGSTGEPALVARSERSLLDEAERYRRGLDLGPADRIALPLPVFHAYALGWLMASLVSGARALLLEPRALGGLQRALEREATVVALTPSLARLLAKRPRAAPGGADLRLVMVGAGPVDSALDATFRERFGLGLARNYGSTETGATLAGPASLPPGCAGRPMPGVRARITDEGGRPCAPGVVGSLEIQLEERDWHSTGDLARAD